MNIVFALHRFLMATTSPTNKNKKKEKKENELNRNENGTNKTSRRRAKENKQIHKFSWLSRNLESNRSQKKKIGTLKWIFHFDINIYLIPLLFALLERHSVGAGSGGGGVSVRIFEFRHPGILHIYLFISGEFSEKCVGDEKNQAEILCEILKESESLAIQAQFNFTFGNSCIARWYSMQDADTAAVTTARILLSDVAFMQARIARKLRTFEYAWVSFSIRYTFWQN